ncbi:MAG: hypothetical protein ACOYM3_00905 [Terrimicrobiaceae bacterium]
MRRRPIKKEALVRKPEPRSKDRRIVLIDQGPLRKEADREARKKMKEAARLNKTLLEFERTIRPGYERWERENLSGLLDEEKRLDDEIKRLEIIIHRVHLESLWGHRTRRSVYNDISREYEMAERDREGEGDGEDSGEPANAGANRSREDESGFDEEAGLPDDERAFRSYVRFASGIDPDELHPREYKRMFGEFCRWRESRSGGSASKAADNRSREDVARRVKDLYRVLVRRLHPDSGGSHADAHRARLWHDLQEAYAAQDIERLEVLLAMTDLHEGTDALRTTLYHLRKVSREMARTVRDLKGRLREARESQAWIFWHSPDRKKAEKEIRYKIASRIQEAKKYLAVLQREMAPWKASPQGHKKSRPHVSGQNFFDF